MKKIFFIIATTGFLLGATVHLLSLAHVDVQDTIPFVWVLHIGIFIAFIPAVLIANRNPGYREARQGGLMDRMNIVKQYKALFSSTPKWLIILTITGFFYMMINFLLFMGNQHGTPEYEGGQYVLMNRGTLIKVITEQEYHAAKANILRGFSGHWMAFYLFSMAVLYPFTKKRAPGLNV